MIFYSIWRERDSSCIECHSELKTTTTWRKHMHIDHNMIFYSRRERQSLCLMSFRVKDDDDLRKLCQVKLFQELIRQKFCLHSQAPSPASPPPFSRKDRHGGVHPLSGLQRLTWREDWGWQSWPVEKVPQTMLASLLIPHPCHKGNAFMETTKILIQNEGWYGINGSGVRVEVHYWWWVLS